MAAAVGQRELLALVSAAGAMYVLAGLQVNHLVAVLVVSLWAAVGLFWSGWRPFWAQATASDDAAPGSQSAGGEGERELKFLPTNAKFVEIVSAIAPLKRFDRARFRELGALLDGFQKKYMYIMSGRSPVDVPSLKDATVDILRVAYSLYVVVPRIGKHFYGDGSLWEVLDEAVQRLREVLTAMVAVVVNHAREIGVDVPNDTGAEPVSRFATGSLASDLP